MKSAGYFFAIALALLVADLPVLAQTVQWASVKDKSTLRQFMDGLKVQRALPNGEIARGEYQADGSGMLYAWGAELPRTWTIEDNGQICITERREAFCYELERNSGMYRVREVATGKEVEFTVDGGQGVVTPNLGKPAARVALPRPLPTKSQPNSPTPIRLSQHLPLKTSSELSRVTCPMQMTNPPTPWCFNPDYPSC